MSVAPTPDETRPANRWRARGTLTGQVQLRVAIAVAAMAVLLSLITIVVAQNLLVSQLDSDIDAIPVFTERDTPNLRRPGVPRGTVIAGRHEGTVFASVAGAGDVSDVDEGLNQLLALEPGRATIELPQLGRYRVHVVERAGSTLAVGLPTRGVDETMIWLSLSALAITAVAVTATVLVTQRLITRATRPLAALGETARTVSSLPLEQGPVAVPRHDVTGLPEEHEVATVGRAFNQMLDHVEGALLARERSEQTLRRFVADASHELRNPLAAITGYSELVEQHARGLEGDTAFALGRISAESQRMRKLVEDMMMLARLDAHQQAAPEPVDATEAVLNAVSDARAAAPSHAWRLVLPDEPVTVLAGRDQLQQVLVNLLGNARTHTPPGTHVETALSPDGIITVTDDGPGIPEDVLPRVFERFSRADDARSHDEQHSTGLGLAIVRAQVESFGGEVWVESRPGCTRFGVRLRLA